MFKSLKRNFYSNYREWAYKNVKPRILAEKFIELSSDDAKMIDYKFYCFNGEPKFLYVSKGLDEHGLAKMDFLKLDWTLAPFYREDYNRFDVIPAKPQCLDKLIKLSKILSNNIPFVRVDWYVIEDKPYFSEMTFYPGGHPIKLTPNDYDKEIGSWLKID